MGGEWGVGAALAFETLPKEGRGFFSGILQEGYAVGYLVAAAAYAVLYKPFSHIMWHGHVVGWRGLFVVGAVPAVLIFYIGGKVEESPVWEHGRFHELHSEKARHQGLLHGIRTYGFTFLFLILLMTGFNAFSHGTQDLYPTYLQHNLGLSPSRTGVIAAIGNVGALLGGICCGGCGTYWKS